MTTVYLVRHGVTDWMEAGLIQGTSDRPLSEFGKEQAALLGKAFEDMTISRIFTSPQLRAVQTARPICDLKKLDAEVVDGLQERDHGWWEGKKYLRYRFHGRFLFLRKLISLFFFSTVSLTGENRAKFEDRVLKAWKSVCSKELDGPVVVVAHSGVLNTILGYVDGNPKEKSRKYFTDNCSISQVEIDADGTARLVRLNDTSHLGEKIWKY